MKSEKESVLCNASDIGHLKDRVEGKGGICTRTTGLQSAQNLKEVYERAARELADLFPSKVRAENFYPRHKLLELTDGTGRNLALYSIVTTGHASLFDHPGRPVYAPEDLGVDYNSIGLVFYDFKIEPLCGDQGELVLPGASKTGSSETSSITADTNASSQQKTCSLQVGTKTTDTMSVSETKTESLQKTNEISSNTSLTVGPSVLNVMTDLGFSTTRKDIAETSVSENKSKKTEISQMQTISVNQDPWTALQFQANQRKNTMLLEYAQPVYVSYKTAVFNLSGRYTNNSILWKGEGFDFDDVNCFNKTFYTEIGNSANGAALSLKARALDNKGDTGFDCAAGHTTLYGWQKGSTIVYDPSRPMVNRLNWITIREIIDTNVKGKAEQAIHNITDKLPSSYWGGAIEREIDADTISLKDSLSVSPLEKVILDGSSSKMAVSEGQTLSLSGLKLKGVTESQRPFYSFDQRNGEWKLTDQQGNVLENCPLGSLQKSWNGSTEFKPAENQSGKAYAKYFIHPGCYKYLDVTKSPAAETEIDPGTVSTPVIENIVVSKEDAFQGRIEASPELNTAFAPGVPIDLNELVNKGVLNVNVFDENDNMVAVPVRWVNNSTHQPGFAVKDGKMTIAEEGTYTIQACYGKASALIKVHAQKEKPVQEEQTCPQPQPEIRPAEKTEPVCQEEQQEEQKEQKEQKKQEEEPVTGQNADFGEAAACLKELFEMKQKGEQIPQDLSGWSNVSLSAEEKQTAFDWAVKTGLLEGLDLSSAAARTEMSKADFAKMVWQSLREQDPESGGVSQESLQDHALEWAASKGLSMENPQESIRKADALGWLNSCLK